jgi:hypothetical protein
MTGPDGNEQLTFKAGCAVGAIYNVVADLDALSSGEFPHAGRLRARRRRCRPVLAMAKDRQQSTGWCGWGWPVSGALLVLRGRRPGHAGGFGLRAAHILGPSSARSTSTASMGWTRLRSRSWSTSFTMPVIFRVKHEDSGGAVCAALALSVHCLTAGRTSSASRQRRRRRAFRQQINPARFSP